MRDQHAARKLHQRSNCYEIYKTPRRLAAHYKEYDGCSIYQSVGGVNADTLNNTKLRYMEIEQQGNQPTLAVALPPNYNWGIITKFRQTPDIIEDTRERERATILWKNGGVEFAHTGNLS